VSARFKGGIPVAPKHDSSPSLITALHGKL
jgi:hypothetical protein